MPSETTTTIKKEKKEKKDKSAKKRAREEEVGAENGERKHKKSKSVVGNIEATNDEAKGETKTKKKSKDIKVEPTSDDEPAMALPTDGQASEEKKEKKKKKKKQGDDGVKVKTEPEASQDVITTEVKSKTKKEKKIKKEKAAVDTTATTTTTAAVEEPSPSHEVTNKKDKKKSKSIKLEDNGAQQTELALRPQSAATQEPNDMEVDSAADTTEPSTSSSKIYAPSDIPAKPQFPFFNQTVSFYEPIYPSGWAAPITGCESQHFRPLQNRYVPTLRGVLLEYSNVTLSETPGRSGAATTDSEPAILSSRAEFGGGFGWITADVRLFVPSRGAWMEGSVNIQTEGHVGVVCFGKFNASVEASRLPATWKWVPNEQADFEDAASVYTAPDEHGVVRQIHSTGHWVDGNGERIKGRLRFRILNFDVGVSGEATYLSLQGTMLDRAAERKLVEVEAKEAQERKDRKGGIGRKKLPEFSMTRFGGDEEEEGEQEKTGAADGKGTEKKESGIVRFED